MYSQKRHSNISSRNVYWALMASGSSPAAKGPSAPLVSQHKLLLTHWSLYHGKGSGGSMPWGLTCLSRIQEYISSLDQGRIVPYKVISLEQAVWALCNYGVFVTIRKRCSRPKGHSDMGEQDLNGPKAHSYTVSGRLPFPSVSTMEDLLSKSLLRNLNPTNWRPTCEGRVSKAPPGEHHFSWALLACYCSCFS